MIIDTTYLLPLAGIGVDTDLLRAIAEGKTVRELSFDELKVSLISVFELQAKASKLRVPPARVCKAIKVIFKTFNVIPFFESDVVEKASELHSLLSDYIDCIILATAICTGDSLVTEDSMILSLRDYVMKNYGVQVLCYQDLVKS